MNKEELREVLKKHKLWLESNGKNGKCAKLKDADLEGANLRGANLWGVNLQYANLRGADLRGANLWGARLQYANLRDANLYGTNLKDANLKDVDLQGVNLDYSCFPLWCGGLDVHIDDKQAIQLLYHLIRNVKFSKNTSEEMKKLLLTKELINKANEFHRVKECEAISNDD